MLRWSTQRNIEAAAERSQEQLDHARDQAKEEREHTAAEATKERNHAAEQATQDRLLKARQELYPALIDDFVEVQKMLGNMATVDLRKNPEAVLPLQKMAANVNKTWIFSSVETAHVVREFYTALNEMHFRLLRFLPLITRTRDAAEAANEECEKLWPKIQELRVRHKKLLESAPQDWFETERTEKELNELRAAYEEIEKTRNKLQSRGSRFNDGFVNELMKEQAKMMQHINLVMAAVRKELGQEGDVAILEAQSEEMTKRIADGMKMVKEYVDPMQFGRVEKQAEPEG